MTTTKLLALLRSLLFTITLTFLSLSAPSLASAEGVKEEEGSSMRRFVFRLREGV